MGYTLYQGDCLEVMPTLEANSVDTVITDPPYGLGFMGKHWDHGVPGVQFWREALRVAKPGAMLLAFGGTRTFHRLTCAIEDAGWEIRDCVTWLYGSGFPKSLDISKAIDKAAGAEREVVGTRRAGIKRNGRTDDEGGIFVGGLPEALKQVPITAPATDAAQQWHGWGTALKPAWEPVILAMKPLDGTFAENALTWGVAGLAIDKGRVGPTVDTRRSKGKNPNSSGAFPHSDDNWVPHVTEAGHIGARWPANLLLDEDAARALDAQSGERPSSPYPYGTNSKGGILNNTGEHRPGSGYSDTGGASRFFYVAKASRAERNAGLEGMEAQFAPKGNHEGRDMSNPKNHLGGLQGSEMANHHPTVKPLALMRYLCRLTATPYGGVVLDPFMGSGTTGVACMLEGRQFVGIDLDPHYCAIAERRIAMTQPALIAEDCEIHP